jgi:hypothetical protein
VADVAATLALWSSTTASNSPAGGTAVGTGLDDNLRELQGVVVRGLSHKGSDIASASTTDIGAVEGLMHDITGTTSIVNLGTVRAGILKILKFDGALTLTHNSTSLILPGAANITTADGDIGIFISEGSGNWRCITYFSAATAPIAATQAEQETGTALTRLVTPGRQHYHQSAVKAWVNFNGTGTPAIVASYNVTSITDSSQGDWVVNLTTGLSASTAGAAVANGSNASQAEGHIFKSIITGTTTVAVNVETVASAEDDVSNINVIVLGDL